MSGSVRAIFAQLRGLWAKAPPRTRALIAGAALVCLVGIGALATATGRPDRVLFSGLDPKDAAAVVSVLEGAKIEHEVAADGTLIRVRAADVDRARLLLAEQNLPGSGNVGFEIFEQRNLGLTDFAQKVNYRRALQGELERTIAALEPVAGARVHLTIPERAVFADEAVPPSASVTVRLRKGRRLEDRQVGAIRHLVAAAVEGLEPSGVTVVDTRGTLLSRGDEDGAPAAALDARRDLERHLEARLTRLLERTVGAGHAQVTVSAEMDFSRTETTEETYDPEQLALRSEQVSQIASGAAAEGPKGLAGAPANQPGAATAQAGGSAGGGTQQLVSNKKYELSRTVVHTVGPAVRVKRITVAAMVDGTYTTPEDGSEPVFTPRSEEELARLKSVLENAVGIDPARGDAVEIVSVPFRDVPAGEDDVPVEAGLPAYLPYAAGGAVALLGLVAFLVLRRKRAAAPAEVVGLPAPLAAVEQVAAGKATGSEGTEAGGAPAALPSADELRAHVLASAEKDPERAAEIIRMWMEEAA